MGIHCCLFLVCACIQKVGKVPESQKRKGKCPTRELLVLPSQKALLTQKNLKIEACKNYVIHT